ncbi:MAG: SH3 domain-containing protein [Limisphaerales bacterium]
MKNRRLFFSLLLAVLWGAFSTWNVRAENISAAFNHANQLYEQQKFSDAASAYEKIIQTGQISSALYFNLGNSWIKAGQIGRAICAYRQAERLSPRDPEVRANLSFARSKAAGGNPPRANFFIRWLNRFSLNEWTVFTAASAALFFLLLAWRQWKSKKNLQTFTKIVGGIFIFCAVSLGLVAQQQLFTESAVVIVPEAVARRGPFEESQSFFTLRDGAELTVLDHKNNWLQIADAQNRIGWLPQTQTLIIH